MDSFMDFIVDPDVEEVYNEQEIDPGLLLRKEHLPWLLGLINTVREQPDLFSMKSECLYCVSCCRYLDRGDDVTIHVHHSPNSTRPLIPLIRVQATEGGPASARAFYVSVQAMREILIPIGDVLSHVLPHPRPDGMGDSLSRCLYLFPQDSKHEMWHGDAFSGRCAYRRCEKIFNNKQSHLRVYGITPQFCSITCKIMTWLCCNIADDGASTSSEVKAAAAETNPPQTSQAERPA